MHFQNRTKTDHNPNEPGLWCTAKYEKSLKLTEIPIIYTEQVLFVVQNTKACHE